MSRKDLLIELRIKANLMIIRWIDTAIRTVVAMAIIAFILIGYRLLSKQYCEYTLRSRECVTVMMPIEAFEQEHWMARRI